MGKFKRTRIIAYTKAQQKLTQDDIYWKQLHATTTVHGTGQVNFIDFSPVKPYYFAATRSAKIEIYDPASCQIVSTITKLKSSAFGGVFRGDGKLLGCGTEDGRLKVFDVQSFSGHSLLRNYKASSGPVRGCQFSVSGKKIASYADDCSVKLWDIGATESAPVTTLSGHTDHVRCGATAWNTDNLFLSGSYDHSAKIWDDRSNECTMTLLHGAPVEGVLIFPNDNIVATAGGTVVKIWSLSNGGQQIARLSRHHKNITVLKQTEGLLFSAGLDKHVKIFDKKTFGLVHTIPYLLPILSLGISKDENALAVGTTRRQGPLTIQRRRPDKVKLNKESEILRGTRTIKDTGKSDMLLGHQDTKAMSRYDSYLQGFQHSKALTYVCKSSYFTQRRPEVIVSLLKELSRRGALHKSLAGREDADLIPVLRFLARNLSNQRFINVIIGTAMVLLDIYQPDCHTFSRGLTNLFRKLSDAVETEYSQQKDMLSLIGSIELIMAQSSKCSMPYNSEKPVIGQPVFERVPRV